MKRSFIFNTLMIFSLAAAPTNVRTWEESVRTGIAAWDRGDAATAEQMLLQSLEQSPDPGLVSFNLGVLFVQRKEWIEAERCFTRSLDDADAPHDRRAKAHYNRAICLLNRGGVTELRAAIDGFERCLLRLEDDGLRGDAQANLELAKLMWADARAKAKNPPKPNDPPANAPPEPETKQGQSSQENPPDNDQDNKDGTKSGQPQSNDPSQQPPKPGSKPKPTDKTVGGKGNLPVRIDSATWRPADESEARDFLSQLSQRLAKDRRKSAEIHAKPERADVKDW